MSSIFELMDLLEDELENSANIPLSSKKKVDIERVYHILDEMRDELPDEIRKAELLLREKQFLLEDAKTQADGLIQDTQRRAAQLVDEHEITIAAQRKAEEILNNAQRNGKEMRSSARAYADDVLKDLESYTSEYLDLVRRNRASLDARTRENISQQSMEQREVRESRESRDTREDPKEDREETERRGIFRGR